MIRDGVLTQTSVSEIETFDHAQYGGCERRWWFDRAVDLKADQNRSQEEGDAGHALLKNYFRTGQRPKGRTLMGKAVTGAIVKGHLPEVGDDLLVELRFDGSFRSDDWKPLDVFETLHLAGVPLDGFIDLAFRRGPVPEVWDHKFFTPARPEVSPDPYAWLKRGSELIETVQMPVYARSQMPYWPDAEKWRLVHHNVSKKGVDSVIRAAVVTRERILERTAQIEGVVERMKLAASAQKQDEMPFNRRSCSAWQGCPHQSICAAFTQKEAMPTTLAPDEAAMFDDLPPIEDDTVEPVPDPKPTAPPPPAAAKGAVPPPPAASVTPAANVTCTCGTVITPENGSKLQDGTWKHIGCKLTAPDAPPKPRRRMPIKDETPASTANVAPPAAAATEQPKSPPAPVEQPAGITTLAPIAAPPMTKVQTVTAFTQSNPKAVATLLRSIADLIDPVP